MTEAAAQRLHLLYCYAPQDQPWLEIIDAHLQELKRQCQITSRFDGELVSNPTQKARLLARFDEIEMVLLLVSPHFQPLEAFWAELMHASRLHDLCAGSYRVVALVLEPVAWNHAPAGAREILPREGGPPGAAWEWGASLEILPSDVKPLTAWPSQEQAFAQIEQWLRVTIEKQWLAYGNALIQDGMTALDEEALAAHEEALAAYEEALRLNPALKYAWYGKAEVLLGLRRYEVMLEEERRRKPVMKRSGVGKDDVFIGPQLYEEALQASNEALRLDAAYCWAW
jgi:hypothetical protein